MQGMQRSHREDWSPRETTNQMSEAPVRDYISGIRRGREIERQTQKSSVVLASLLGFTFGTMFGIIICLVGYIL